MNDPLVWNYILQHLPATSVIAGGAVRDFYFGLTPKDIDVFVPIGYIFNQAQAFNYVPPVQVDRLAEYNNNSIMTVHDYDLDFRNDGGALRVQVVEVNMDPTAFVNHTFDLSVSKAAYSRTNGLHFSHEFMQSTISKEIRLNIVAQTDLQRTKSVARANKFIQKIGDGWTRQGF